jgi:hypothetical protein
MTDQAPGTAHEPTIHYGAHLRGCDDLYVSWAKRYAVSGAWQIVETLTNRIENQTLKGLMQHALNLNAQGQGEQARHILGLLTDNRLDDALAVWAQQLVTSRDFERAEAVIRSVVDEQRRGKAEAWLRRQREAA